MRKIISIIFIAVLLFCTGCSTQEEITVPQSSSSSAAVLIEDPDTVKEITLSETDITLAVGDTYQINYSVMPENAGEQVMFTASNNNAEVSDTGLVTVLNEGSTTVAVSTQKAHAELEITSFIRKAESIKMPESLIIGIDENVFSDIKVQPENASIKKFDWAVEDESILSIDENGVLTGKAKGTTTVYAKTKDGSDLETSATVTVTRGPFKELSEIEKSRFELTDGIYTNPASTKQNEARLMMTGDLMALSAQQFAVSGKGYNFNDSFSKVKDIFAKADFVIGNLETLTSHSSPYTYEQKEANGNPLCNAPATYLDAVKYANFDAVVTANNHSSDAGRQGLIETIRMLDKYDIQHTGTFKDADAKRYLLYDINGIKTAVLSYTEISNNFWGYNSDEERSIMMNMWSEEKIKNDIRAAKEEGAEFIIAYNHWGIEHTHNVTGDQRAHAQIMADAGVDLIIGSHTHCLQEADIIKASDGREVPCIYSMGNFVSSMAQTIHNDTIILVADIKKDENNNVSIENWGYIPAKVYPSFSDSSHVIIPTSPALNGNISSDNLSSAADRIANVMGDKITEITELK